MIERKKRNSFDLPRLVYMRKGLLSFFFLPRIGILIPIKTCSLPHDPIRGAALRLILYLTQEFYKEQSSIYNIVSMLIIPCRERES